MASKKAEIISITIVKPSSPTPTHLRTFKLSLGDQLSSNVYPHMIFFYPYDTAVSGCPQPHHDFTDYFSSKSRLLQKALSETLTHFYPLAGRFHDDSTMTCNDEGVVFTESKTSCLLSDLLASPDYDLIYNEVVSTIYQEAMQASNGSTLIFNFVLFRCGGIALSVAESHKVFDMSSLMTFFKSLSAACRGSAETITPDFHAIPARLPSREVTATAAHFGKPHKVSTRSFVFSASKVQQLKTIASISLRNEGYEFDYLSRVNVVMAFLWKCLVKTFISHRSTFRPTFMAQTSNFRNRVEPAIPSNAMGNLSYMYATDIIERESDVELSELVKKLLELRVLINEKAKGFNAEQVVEASTQVLTEIFEKNDDMDLCIGTSWCRFEFYDLDFGMGKPVWVTSIAPELLTSCIMLLDTKEEGGIEALMFLEEEEMKAFERNQKLRQFAVPKTVAMYSSSGL